MGVVKTGSKFSITMSYDPAERRRAEAEIAVVELLVADLQRRAAISKDPCDYFELSDTIQRLAGLYAHRCVFLIADLRRLEALIPAGLSRQAELAEPAVSDPSGEVVQQQEIGQDEDDDWEALADNEAALANLLLSSPPAYTTVSEPPNADEPDAPARRRGRGSFLYRTNELYSDQVDDAPLVDHDSEVQDAGINSSPEDSGTLRNQQFGTNHVILLYDFPCTTRIQYLESIFENFACVAIRRVSYTVALAVFRTPTAAQQAQTGIKFPFKVRRLEEGDIALHKIPQEDLEPPAARRPWTSSPRTARRMIGHAMGIEPGSSSSAGALSEEFRMQEAARKNRLHQRHDMKDAAWGPDDE